MPIVCSQQHISSDLIDHLAATSLAQQPHSDDTVPALEDDSLLASLPRESIDMSQLCNERGKRIRAYLSQLYTNPVNCNHIFEQLFVSGNVHDVSVKEEINS